MHSLSPSGKGRDADVNQDVFGSEEGHDIKFRTMSWQIVAVLMISEIVSNGMLSLPSSLATVGIVPAVIIIVFLGTFALFTAWLLIEFKLNHKGVHNMGDAGMIMFGPVGREVFSAGTIIFAIAATSGQLLAGQLALSQLSNNAICSVIFALVFAIATMIGAAPRTLGDMSWLGIVGFVSIMVAGVVGMVGAGLYPESPREISVSLQPTFYDAFVSITNPVFAYAGHFMFFVLISEMKNPKDAMKAAWTLQTFATGFYVAFAIVTYIFIGNTVASPSFSSLSPLWSKLAYGLALPNFLIAGCLYIHVAAKIIFLRIFRNSRHLHSKTLVGYSTWAILILVSTSIAFILAVAVPIFNLLIGVIASLFASWYTYGIAGMFWIHDTYHGINRDGRGMAELMRHRIMFFLSIATILIGAFICVTGTYVSIKLIVDAYATGAVGTPFKC